MNRYKFAIYPPASGGLPWLAVALDRDKVADAFPCPSKVAAETVMESMKARWTAKNWRAYA